MSTKAWKGNEDLAAHMKRIEEENEECPKCGHEMRLHGDKYGCQYERGDVFVTGNQAEQPTVLMARGPCGCKAERKK